MRRVVKVFEDFKFVQELREEIERVKNPVTMYKPIVEGESLAT